VLVGLKAVGQGLSVEVDAASLQPLGTPPPKAGTPADGIAMPRPGSPRTLARAR
jgi:hypothetical protein